VKKNKSPREYRGANPRKYRGANPRKYRGANPREYRGANDSFLEKVGIFSLLSPEEIQRVAEHLASAELAAGETLFREGDEGNDLYIIAKGSVAITIRLPDGAEREIVRFAPGEFFGEMSIFDNAPRSASCRSLEASALYSLSKSAFSDIIELHPRIAQKLMYRMLNVTTQRLRGTSEFVSEMVLWGESARRRAITDELTGVYNRRFLEDSLGNYLAEAAEKGTPMSLAMTDLDYFRQINEAYGHEKGDEAIKSAARIYKSFLREKDIIARYGGDEFQFILPATGAVEAAALLTRVCAEVSKLEILKGLNGPVTTVTTSMGVAAYPENAADLSALRAAADAALYKAKEGGRNRVESAPPLRREAASKGPAKSAIRSIRAKNAVIDNIIKAIMERRGFIILGHQNPDDDCLSAMISFALVLHMFYRNATIHVGGQLHERFQYLLDICRYNSIPIAGPDTPLPAEVDTLVLCDTPKPSMIEASPAMRELMNDPRVVRIEIDHHIGADSAYFGDEGYRLVTEASSACELIGHILLKLEGRRDLLESHQVSDLFPRNLVLAILTGIIGDSSMGQYLKSRREKRYYGIFSAMFNDMLSRRTTKKTNFFTMDQVFSELQKLSKNEAGCFSYMMERKRSSPSIGIVAMSLEAMAPLYAECDNDTIVSTARVIADRLAEESGKLSLVAYYDNPERGDLIQFRVRRAGSWKKYDVRSILPLFSIKNGGGHEGAIAFRVPRDTVPDFDAYMRMLVDGIEAAIPK
jgi:diguanylate cyclase (GGDEF)-like protein